MSGEERRNLILKRLSEESKPISATVLAKQFSVTRQIIVADIALLRASGNKIVSVHYGYLLNKTELQGIIKQVVVKHGKDEICSEFYAVIDNGGKILEVMVEHEIYGLISAKMEIGTRYEADLFVNKIKRSSINPLSSLTKGVHIHTLLVPNNQSFERIKSKLKQLNIFIESN